MFTSTTLYVLLSVFASGRLILGVLACYVACKALGDSDLPQDDWEAAERLRAHRYAVLQAVLGCLKPTAPGVGRRRSPRPARRGESHRRSPRSRRIQDLVS